MSLKRNIFANYLGTGAVVFAPIVALPWYLSELGSKQFGLISFIATLQAILGLLDAGMSQALVREIAVRFDQTDKRQHEVASLLLGFERIYWIFALCSGCLVGLLAKTIATHWLNLDDLPVIIGQEAIYGAAFIFAAQFPGSIYRSILVGTQAQIPLNGIMATCALMRHLGGVAIVVVWPTLPAYLIWHAAIALLETLVRGKWAWGVLGLRHNQAKWDIKQMLPLWRSVAGMSVVTLLGALTVQIDKIVLSRMVSIEQFGYYTIAASLAVGALQLINPLTQAVLPRAIQMRHNPIGLRNLNVKFLGAITLLVGLGFLVFIAFGRRLLDIWLRNPEAVTAVYPTLTILLIGTALNAFYNVGYVNWLARQKNYILIRVNAISLMLSIALIPTLVLRVGTVGAAISWLTINFIGLVFSLGWLKREVK